MHLDCAIAHLGYCQGNYKVIDDALHDFGVIREKLDMHIKQLEKTYKSEVN